MKRRLVIVLTSVCLVCAPAFAHGSGSNDNEKSTLFTKENIGKAVGAAAGALIGAQFGGGSGKLVAIAIGTLAGFWAGGKVGRRLSERDKAGIAYSTHQALETGETQTWENPDTGVTTRVSVRDAERGEVTQGWAPLNEVPMLELLNQFHVANANVNVRGGPSTEYGILYRVPRGAKVPVVGRVHDSNWLMIAEQGVGSGFVYGPLFSPSPSSDNALRDSTGSGEVAPAYEPAYSDCRIISQEVALPGQNPDAHKFRACRQPDGTWMEV